MIELENIKKHYRLNGQDVMILKGINVFIGQGEFVSIMGPSGSGKSTLSAILGCLSTPTSGSYKLNGQNITALSQNQLARMRNQSIGFIFQDFNLLSGLTALENVELPLVYGGKSSRQRRERAMECLAAVGLEQKSQNKPFQLSGGQKQRVAIARALVNHPKFLFADEPTGALDKKTGHEILAIMQRLNMQGHTVIQVTHSPNDSLYSKRILHLVDGNIVREETVEKPIIGTLVSGEETMHEEIVSKMWRVAQLAPVLGNRDLPAITRLIHSSTSRDAHIAAARAIVRWSGSQVESSIESLFTSSDWVVRTEIIKSLNLRPKEESIPYYIRAIADANPWVRHIAMTELKGMEQIDLSEAAQAAVIACRGDSDERVRASAIFIVGEWQIPDKESIIAEAMADKDNRVRANAVECLKEHDMQLMFLDRLIEMSRSDRNNRVRANAAQILVKHRPEIAIDVATQMLSAPEVLMRSSGAWLIGMIRAPKFDEILIEMLRSEKEDVVINQVVRSLAKISRDRFSLTDQVNGVLGLQAEGV